MRELDESEVRVGWHCKPLLKAGLVESQGELWVLEAPEEDLLNDMSSHPWRGFASAVCKERGSSRR